MERGYAISFVWVERSARDVSRHGPQDPARRLLKMDDGQRRFDLIISRDANTSGGFGDSDCVPVGGNGAGDLFSARVAGREGLFFRGADGAMVGAGVFD